MTCVHLMALWIFIGQVFAKLSPRPVARDVATTTTTSAAAQSTICGDIIDEVNQGFRIFYASAAVECLTSVPFNDAVATRFIDYYNTTLQFQSTLAYLRDPPQGYQQPAVDVLQGLQQIQQNITAGYYKNQYVFEADLQLLILSLHDAHVVLNAGILSAFSFASPYAISSVSIDGKQAPKVYITDDIISGQLQGWQPSPISSINGEDVVDYLTRFAALNSFGTLEPHADWNQLMHTPVLDIQGFLSVFSGAATFYPGDKLNFTFENGTELPTYWLAIYNEQDPTGPLTTGGDFYNYFVLGLLPDSFNSSLSSSGAPSTGNGSTDNGSTDVGSADNGSADNSTTPSWNEDSFGAYPDPDIVQPDLSISGGGIVTGYYLRDISIGVLSIPSFSQYGENIGNFSDTVARFIEGATAANLSRVVIDLQQNAGGQVELAFDTFKQFFPERDPFAGSRRRIHELANVLGGALTAHWDDLPSNDSSYLDLVANEWVVTQRLNAATGRNFTSWSEYRGPVRDRGDDFSLTERYNVSSAIFDAASFDGWLPYGYTPENPVRTSQPWRPEDIVILTDGLCSSACSLFLEMLAYETGVRTVAVGGRPSTGPMQAASGSRGARVYSTDELDDDFEQASGVNETARTRLPQIRDPGIFTNYAGFNLRDQIRPNDTFPLQFKYRAADCRIYHTIANIYNMSRLWRDAASANWEDGSLCVEASTGYASSGNNPTAPKAPPAPTAQDYDIDPMQVELNVEATGGLQAARVAASGRNPDPQLCSEGGFCDGTQQCQYVTATCSSTRRRRKIWACVSSCNNRNVDSCPGTTQCLLGAQADSKSNSPSGSSISANFPTRQRQPLRQGFCLPLPRTIFPC